ncbi:MAG: hydrogen peroxide-inducible genes activator [Hyphomicrobiales bacterium]
MTTLRQLSYLVALSEELHFRRAAERVNVTQPTLSMQIQELERRLEATLVERNQGRVILTPLGGKIADRAKRVLSEIKEIENLAASAQHGLHGTVRLGVPPTLGAYLLPHIVPSLHMKHPDLKLYVKEGKPIDLQAQLQAGSLDLIVSPLPLQKSDFFVERLFREPLRLVVANDHDLATKANIERKDLDGQYVLTIERGHHLYEQVRILCEEFGATLLRDYEGTSLDTIRLMAGMGVGIAFLPALYIRSEISERDKLKVLEFSANNLHRQIGLAWRGRSVQSEQFSEIADLIRSICVDRFPEITVFR